MTIHSFISLRTFCEFLGDGMVHQEQNEEIGSEHNMYMYIFLYYSEAMNDLKEQEQPAAGEGLRDERKRERGRDEVTTATAFSVLSRRMAMDGMYVMMVSLLQWLGPK